MSYSQSDAAFEFQSRLDDCLANADVEMAIQLSHEFQDMGDEEQADKMRKLARQWASDPHDNYVEEILSGVRK